ncbi:protein GVQW3-like [Aphis craccivora]|uniref:Protein GVQW3-like n=1 Tax=Aphis craccivora TaxID=307492 RepID=A0A6G0VQD4_APHCR|nr:protein GVQW3-like [Aphis craccivora]
MRFGIQSVGTLSDRSSRINAATGTFDVGRRTDELLTFRRLAGGSGDYTTPPPINTSAEHKIGQYSVLPYRSKTHPGQNCATHQGQTCAVLLHGKNNKTSAKNNKIQSTYVEKCGQMNFSCETCLLSLPPSKKSTPLFIMIPYEMFNEIRTVYEEGHMNCTNVYKSCRDFKYGRTNVKGADDKWTKEVAEAFYEAGIKILISRLTTNIERDGDYIEK